MHDCRKFRERAVENEFGAAPNSLREIELHSCPDCGRFLDEMLAVHRAISDVGAIEAGGLAPEESWERFEKRLRSRLVLDPLPRRPLAGWLDRLAVLWGWRFMPHPRWLALAAVTAIVAVASWRWSVRVEPVPDAPAASAASLALDPKTVDFLGRSEMFLRDFSKLEPTDTLDLEDARDRARAQLGAIAQRKAAVAGVPPVWAALEEYETVLREIKNLDGNFEGDVEDIQERIARQGLIAAMKVYQPQTARADRSHGLREN
jgi:hypothetical protein